MKKYLLFFLMLTVSPFAFANDITISNFTVTAIDRINKKVEVTFDISWENSWILPGKNHDAAWVFMKWYDPARYCYRKCTISSVSSLGADGDADGEPDDVESLVAENGVGFFLRRHVSLTANYFGTLTRTGVKVLWDYPSDLYNGAIDLQAKSARLKIFAIEMVYVPEGEYYLGDGAAGIESVKSFHEEDNKAFLVTDEMKNFTWDDQGSTLNFAISLSSGLKVNSVTYPDYPTGGKAFYCMKYEISQGQYKDFLNTLSREQQTEHVLTNITSSFGSGTVAHEMVMTDTDITNIVNRQAISMPESFNAPYISIVFGCDYNANRVFDEADDGECIALGNIDWLDFGAYADWAGLRPMTEFEYEKACRGPAVPTAGDYAWGSKAAPTYASDNPTDAGTKFESVSTKGFGLVYLGSFPSSGPLRSGFAAQNVSGTRGDYGASCWGIMDLSGNQAEWLIGIDGFIGYNEYTYKGEHGDGNLDSFGLYDAFGTESWPPTGKNGTTGNAFYNPDLRGGVYNPSSLTMELMPVSARESYAQDASVVVRHGRSSGRFVRTEL